MAILLKEITVRYFPKTNSPLQKIRDYFAMFNVWRTEGGGGQPGTTGERRTEFVNDVFEQVATQLAEMLNRRLAAEWMGYAESNRKEIQKFNHAFKTKNWLDFHAAIESMLANIMGKSWMQSLKMADTDPKQNYTNLSPAIQNFVKSTFKGTEFPKPPEPAWKKYDKPMTGAPAAVQRDLPMAGGQGDLPLTPREKLPAMQKDLPPLQKPFATGEPKRIGANWEDVLKSFGYEWSEEDNAYKNAARNVMIQVQPNNSVKVFLPSGKTKHIKNLGLLFRTLGHNKAKRHGKEPVAQVTKENYKGLFEFLYT